MCGRPLRIFAGPSKADRMNAAKVLLGVVSCGRDPLLRGTCLAVLAPWVRVMATPSTLAQTLQQLQVRAFQICWRERLGLARRGSADLPIRVLPSAPLLTTTTASDLIGRSFQATGQAIDRLAGAGILTQVTVGRRNRAFDAPELIEAFAALERQLASPLGDTLVSEPIGRVPRMPG